MREVRAWRRMAALVIPMLAVVAACGGEGAATPQPGTGKGTIKVWAHQGQEGEVKALQDAVADFNKSQGDVKAKLQFIPEADYPKTIAVTKPSGLPDVLEFDGTLVSSLVYSYKLAPLQGLVAPATVANQTDSVKAENTYPGDGKLYGVAMFDSGLGMYGNRKLLDAAGVKYPTSLGDDWTADQFQSALAALAAKDSDGKVLDIKENYGGEWPTYGFLPVLYSTGSVVIKDNRAEGNLNSPKVVRAVEQFAGWRKYVDANTDDKAFVNGRVALSWVGHWLYNDYAKALGKNLVVLPLPNFGDGPKSGQGSLSWGISPRTKNAKAAAKFLDFLMSDGPVTAMTDANAAPPGTKTVAAKSKLYKPGGPLELFAQQLQETCGTGAPTTSCVATPRPVSAAYGIISQEFSKAFFSAYNGGDAQAQLDKAARAIDLDFKDNDDYGLR